MKDHDLARHLIHFGIEISEQIKTEKTMTELSLEINLNFTLSKQIEEGKILTPIYGPGYTGMENLGNSCYMNSVLQILFSLETFLSKYLDNALFHLSSCTNDPPECFLCQVSKVIYGMHSGIYSTKQLKKLVDSTEIEEYQYGIKPASFKYLFGRDHPEFSSNRQQDAFEYLAYILDKFEKFEKSQGLETSIKSFEFDLESRIECQECKSVKYKNQRTWYLPLSIPNWQNKLEEGATVNMDECISKFLGEEIVNLNCPICNKSTHFIKTQRVKNYPRYLIVIFERFVYDWVPKKLEVQFIVKNDDIDISVFSRNHSKDGEKVLEDEEENTEEEDISFNQNDVNYLTNNGVPELAAKHALFNSGNNVDVALIWFYEHIDDPSINNHLPKKKSAAKVKFNEDDIQTLISFGFNRNQAESALLKYSGNVEMAANQLFTNPTEFQDVEMKVDNIQIQINENNSSKYDLYGNYNLS